MQLTSYLDESLASASRLAIDRQDLAVSVFHLWAIFLDDPSSGISLLYERMGMNASYLKKFVQGRLDKLEISPDSLTERYGYIITTQLAELFDRASEKASLLSDDYLAGDLLLIELMAERNHPISDYLSRKRLSYEDVFYQVKKQRGGQKVRTTTNQIHNRPEFQSLDYTQFGTELTQAMDQAGVDPVIGRDEEIRDLIRILLRKNKNNPVLVGHPGVGKTAIVEGLAQRIVADDVPKPLLGTEIFSLDLGALIAGASYRGEFEERLKMVMDQVKDSQGQVIVFIDEIHTIVGAGKGEGSMDAGNLLKPMLARGEIQVIGSTTIEEYRQNFEKDKALERRFQPIYVEEPSLEETVTILRGLKAGFEDYNGVQITDEAIQAAAEMSERYLTERFLPDKVIDLLDEASAMIYYQRQSIPSSLDQARRRVDSLEKEISQVKVEDKAYSALQADLEEAKSNLAQLEAVWDKEGPLIEKIEEARQKIKNLEGDLEEAELNFDFEVMQEVKEEKIPELRAEIESHQADLVNLDDRLIQDEVTADHVASILARHTGIPVDDLVEEDRAKLLALEDQLKKAVVGQDNPVSSLVEAIIRAYAGVQDPDKPLGSFLFLGPTGVGKTELAKTLAKELFGSEKNLIRIDMSEYMEKHAVSRLVGAPPGYVGFEEGGQLTEQVRTNPYSIILLDEIEKAHPDVFNILLQVLDDGRLTDSQGRLVDFKNVILIMTSNIGSNYLLDSMEEAGKITEEAEQAVENSLRASFRPEFLNRIDEILLFSPLTIENIKEIVKLRLQELNQRLAKQAIELRVSDQAIDWLAENGFEPAFGARPISRFLMAEIETPLAQKIIQEDLKPGEEIQINLEDDQLKFSSQDQGK